jgi:hypothetical protein
MLYPRIIQLRIIYLRSLLLVAPSHALILCSSFGYDLAQIP